MAECDNSSRQGRTIISPTCYNGEVSNRVTVHYNYGESDTHDLCLACTKALKRDARRHGYSVKVVKI